MLHESSSMTHNRKVRGRSHEEYENIRKLKAHRILIEITVQEICFIVLIGTFQLAL